MRASNWMGSDAAKLRISNRRLRTVRFAIRNPQSAVVVVRERRLRPTAFLIGHQSFALSRISIISHIFHSRPASRTRLTDRDTRSTNQRETTLDYDGVYSRTKVQDNPAAFASFAWSPSQVTKLVYPAIIASVTCKVSSERVVNFAVKRAPSNSASA